MNVVPDNVKINLPFRIRCTGVQYKKALEVARKEDRSTSIIEEMFQWAKTYASDGYWDFFILSNPDAFAFGFSKDEDAVAYALVFSKYL